MCTLYYLGMLLYSLLLLYPALKLDWAPNAMALRQCCVATFVMMMMSVPEFYLVSRSLDIFSTRLPPIVCMRSINDASLSVHAVAAMMV